MTTVKDISNFINDIAPYNIACGWDNCGLLIGDETKEVKTVAFALDLTEETLKNALNENAELLVTHHPAIFHAPKNLLADSLEYQTVISGITVISAHTCFDCADGGVNDVLASVLGLCNVSKIASNECAEPMARLGELPKIMSAEEFAHYVSKKLGTAVRFCRANDNIKKVAVCGGAGMSFLDDVKAAGADAYVTADTKYHEMMRSAQLNITTVDAGHFETENPSIPFLCNYVAQHFENLRCVVVKQSKTIEFIS